MSHADDIPGTEGKFRLDEKTAAVMPIGLRNDSYLLPLGIRSHSVEDYLIKLLVLDVSLRSDVPLFSELLQELLGRIRGEPYKILFESSKELFQLVKPIIKHGFSDTGVVKSMFQNANPDVLHSVMDPLLQRLETAVGP